MRSRYLWRVAVVVVLCVALCTPVRATPSLGSDAIGIIALAVVGAVAVVGVIVVAVHESAKPRTITGCVNSANNAMTLNNEKDKQVYLLTGDTASVKSGERLTLRGKKVNAGASHALTWETKKVVKDLGACQP